jgi:hypothetical protein
MLGQVMQAMWRTNLWRAQKDDSVLAVLPLSMASEQSKALCMSMSSKRRFKGMFKHRAAKQCGHGAVYLQCARYARQFGRLRGTAGLRDFACGGYTLCFDGLGSSYPSCSTPVDKPHVSTGQARLNPCLRTDAILGKAAACSSALFAPNVRSYASVFELSFS